MSDLARQLIAENKKTKATFLDLGSCGLVNEIPEELGDCVWLEELNLGKRYKDRNGNYIVNDNLDRYNEFIGDELKILSKLKDLKVLDLFAVKTSDFCFLSDLVGLQHLCLAGNRISDCSFLSGLVCLQHLDLRVNEISDCSFLSGLVSLQHLDIACNQISDCSFLSDLVSLQNLHLSENRISDCSFLSGLVGLEHLDLRKNQISNCSFLSGLVGLQELDLRSNQISDLSFLNGLVGLQELDLSSNQISDCSFLSGLVGLRRLYLGSNQISDCSFLSGLVGLQDLELSSNQISDCSFLSGLAGLKNLYLGSNQISDCSFLSVLVGLQDLYLGSNQISDLSFLSGLVGLRALYLRSNQISDLGTVRKILFMRSLSAIELTGNPLLLPSEIDLKSLDDLRSFFRDLEEGASPDRFVKLLFLGDGCVGKTTLLKHLKNGYPINVIHKEDRTHGIALDIWQNDLENIEINVWDFGGQEIFHGTHRLFLGQRSIYVLVWTKQENKICSEDEQHPLKYWLDFIAEYGTESTVLLVENTINGKFDSHSFPDDATLEDLVEEFKEKKIRLIPTNHRINCQHDSREIKKFKGILLSEIENLLEDYPIAEFPANRAKVIEFLAGLKEEYKTIPKAHYLEICSQYKISNPDIFLEYLNRTGVVSYIDGLFGDTVILRTEWVLDAIYESLRLKENPLKVKGGKITANDFDVIWKDYSSEEKAVFKDYMLKTELLVVPYHFDGEYLNRGYQYLIPALFPNRPLHEKFKWDKELKYWAVKFGFIYPSIIQQLQVKILRFCNFEEEESLFKNYLAFTSKANEICHVELLEDVKEMRIWAESEELFVEVINLLNEIYPLKKVKVFERFRNQAARLIEFDEKDANKIYLKKDVTVMPKKKITAFVTYCWTDGNGKNDEVHQRKIHSLVNALREKGFEATFDKALNDQSTANNFMKMMVENIDKNDKVVVVLSEGYAVKARDFRGGVGEEYQLLINDIRDHPRKYVLVSFSGRGSEIYPLALKGRDTIDLSKSDPQEIENLLRKLSDKSSIKLKEIGGEFDLPDPDDVPSLF